MAKSIDNILNKITMYRLVLYYLIFLWINALLLSFFELLPFTISHFLSATFVVLIACWISNRLFSSIFKSLTNLESVYISALIIVLIITPFRSISELMFIIFVSLIAMASKYLFALNKKHIFNPVAFAVFATSVLTIGSASWWVGNQWMLPAVLIGGILIIRKIQRFSLFFSFLATALFTMSVFSLINGFNSLQIVSTTIINSPILFFSFVMLIEPLTTPTSKNFQIIYGILVGILFYPKLHIASYYITPEASLLIGNIFSYIVNPNYKLMLFLKEKIKIAPDIYEFVFNLNKKINFSPGQYLEWTLGFKSPDNRGNRRYFTIASSPTEKLLRIGVKFYPDSSSFKKNLISLKSGDKILAGQLSGDFVLPKNKSEKLVFIAGGIGITPFRSMIKYLLDNKIKMPIVIFYSSKSKEEIVYKDVFDNAEKILGIKTIYSLTDLENIPKDWKGEKGRINSQMIKKHVPDFKYRSFYLSGPRPMVVGFEEVLRKMGIKGDSIKKDFFPGYA
ncbi:MAG: hypothetical protein A2171_01755 [Candidatus Levybacteria bacterium RBG_13_35_9]|nr:MAG: hypothetical protein A2171_01755 [Candidatus Levybacteria bacterium RBG_13_35_9]